MFGLMITFEDKTCSHLTDYTSVWIISSLQQHGAGNFRVPVVRPLNSLRTKDSSIWWHLKFLQLTLVIQCPVWFCSLVMENLIGERFPAWHCSARHTTTHTSNTQNTTLVQGMFLNPSSKQARTYLIMAWRSGTSLSLYMPSCVGIICIYPIMNDDRMWRSVQAKNLFAISSGPSFQPTVPNHWHSSCCSYVTVPWKGEAFISVLLFSLLPGTINFSHNWKVHLIVVIVVWTTLTAQRVSKFSGVYYECEHGCLLSWWEQSREASPSKLLSFNAICESIEIIPSCLGDHILRSNRNKRKFGARNNYLICIVFCIL
jgi:hypothetical protein